MEPIAVLVAPVPISQVALWQTALVGTQYCTSTWSDRFGGFAQLLACEAQPL